jgi:hypothetical protein
MIIFVVDNISVLFWTSFAHAQKHVANNTVYNKKYFMFIKTYSLYYGRGTLPPSVTKVCPVVKSDLSDSR